MKFSENLWNKYDFQNDRYKKQYDNFRNFIEIISKMQIACLDYSKALKNVISKNYRLIDDEESSLGKCIEALRFNYLVQSNEFNLISEHFRTKILEPARIFLDQTYNKEKEKYSELKKSISRYNDAIATNEKAKQRFYTAAQAAENLMITVRRMKAKALASTNNQEIEQTYKKAKGLLEEAKGYEKIYVTTLEKANTARVESIEKQNLWQESMETLENDFNLNIKTQISFFIGSLKKLVSNILLDLESLNDKFNNISIEGDIKEYVNMNKCREVPDKEILFEPYKPLTRTGGAYEQLTKNFHVLKELKTALKDVLPQYDLEKETLKNEIRDLCIRVFKTNKDFVKEDMDKLLAFVKEKESRCTFLFTLNKQRVSGQFNRSERVMNYLTELVKKILEVSEAEKDFESAKNCIILSQTFYIDKKIEKKIEKKYLFEMIQDNKWLRSVGFWYGIIDKMIELEIEKNVIANKESTTKDSELEKKRKISNIVFSQLLPYTSNMLDFKIDKKIVLGVVDKYVKKYEIAKDLAEIIVSNVNDRKF